MLSLTHTNAANRTWIHTVFVMRLRAKYLRAFEVAELTGLSGSHFGELVRRLWMLHSDSGRGRPWALSFPDRVLLTTIYLRTNLTERQLAVLFAVSQKQVDRVLHDLMVPLGDLLGSAPTGQRELRVSPAR